MGWGQDVAALQWHWDAYHPRHVHSRHPAMTQGFSSNTDSETLLWGRNGLLWWKQGHPLCLQVLGALV